jgi:hypothetical protein
MYLYKCKHPCMHTDSNFLKKNMLEMYYILDNDGNNI